MPTLLTQLKSSRDIYRDKIAKLIAKLKKGEGYSKEELAKLLGIAVSTLGAYKFTRDFKTVKDHDKVIYFIK